jgi:uncharacterized delta-60 repeat protein
MGLMKLGSLRKGAAAALRARARARIDILENRVLMSAGDLDTEWGPTGSNGFVQTDIGATPGTQSDVPASMAVDADGNVYTAGTSQGADIQRFSLTRHDANGVLDETFGDGGRVVTEFVNNNNIAHSVAIQDDGKIVVAGIVGLGAAGDALAVARYLDSGELDPTFGSSSPAGRSSTSPVRRSATSMSSSAKTI